MITERKRLTNKIWKQNNKEHVQNYDKNYQQNNPDKNYAKVKGWRKRNPDKHNAYQRKYRDNLVIIEHIDRIVVWNNQNRLCALCNLEILLEDLSLDHIVPVSLGGRHEYTNIQAAHKKCNSKKGNRIL